MMSEEERRNIVEAKLRDADEMMKVAAVNHE